MIQTIIKWIKELFCFSVMDIQEGDTLRVDFIDEENNCFVRKKVVRVFGPDEDWSGQKGIRVQFEHECVPVVITDNNDIYKITRE